MMKTMMSIRCMQMETMVERVVEVEQCLVETLGQQCSQVGILL